MPIVTTKNIHLKLYQILLIILIFFTFIFAGIFIWNNLPVRFFKTTTEKGSYNNTHIDVAGNTNNLELKAGSHTPDGWYSTDWKYRRKISFKKINTQKNFPVLISLTTKNFDFKNAKEDGSDIIFISSDNQTELEAELVSWENNKATLWVNIPELKVDTNTYFYIYYGNQTDYKFQSRQTVWDSNFLIVNHLNSTTEEEQTIYKNSGVNGFDAKPFEFDGSTEKKESLLDYGIELDGSGSHLQINHNEQLNLGKVEDSYTVEALIYYTGDNAHNIVTKGQEFWGNGINALNLSIAPSSVGLDRQQKPLFGFSTSSEENFYAGGDKDFRLSEPGWYYVTGVKDTVTKSDIVFVNGKQISNTQYQTDKPATREEPIRIGSNIGGEGFRGIIDEVRISSSARSAEWIELQKLNLFGELITIEPEVTVYPNTGSWELDTQSQIIKNTLRFLQLPKSSESKIITAELTNLENDNEIIFYVRFGNNIKTLETREYSILKSFKNNTKAEILYSEFEALNIPKNSLMQFKIELKSIKGTETPGIKNVKVYY